jgi:hypothetical protein
MLKTVFIKTSGSLSLVIKLTLLTMNKLLLTLALLIGFFGIANAQKEPVKFGKISKSDLLSNVYAPDTSAPAVVLCDYGYFMETSFTTIRVLRIKILKKEGYQWANQTFNVDNRAAIRGITHNLLGDEIVETKLKNESIFENRITENYYETRVAMPNVKVGSVIDIEFVYPGIPAFWDFQLEIPVVHSELVIKPISYLKFNKNFYGSIPLTISTEGRWVADNVPAFKAEPYMSSSKNYRLRIEFDLEYISYQGYRQLYATTWDKVRDQLYSNNNFGSALSLDGYLKSVAKEIKAGSKSQDEMIRKAYDYSKQIHWDGIEQVFTSKASLNNVYKEGKGNSADINLALVQLLKNLELNAGPVVMSSRSNGILSPLHPSIQKLNYVIVAVFTEKDTILLDATEENSPYYLLPMRALNKQGQFVDKSRTGWVQLQTKKKDKQMVAYTMSIGEDLSLKGKLTFSKGDYAALDFRNDYEEFNSEDEYLNNYKEGKNGLKIVSHQILNLDSLYKPIKEEFEVSINNGVGNMDGELYIIPLLYEQMTENPFKVSDRKYPIDFGYTRDKTVIVTYTFPQGYSVTNYPAAINMKLPGNTAAYSCTSTITEGKISIIYKLNINNSLIPQSQYADFREFYNQIIAKEAEPVVLKKI